VSEISDQKEERPSVALVTLGFGYFHSFVFFSVSLSLALVLNLFELVQWTESLPPSLVAYQLNRMAQILVSSPALNTLQEPRVAIREFGQGSWMGDLMSSMAAKTSREQGLLTIGEPVMELVSVSGTAAGVNGSAEKRGPAAVPASGTEPRPYGTVTLEKEDLGVNDGQRPPVSFRARKFLFAGDSMLGSALQFKIKSYFVHEFKGANNYRILAKPGTGLTKPNLYNWNEVLSSELVTYPVDILVLFLGTNDNGHIRSEGHAYKFGGKKWDRAYGDRLRGLLENACQKVSKVLWVNQMPMLDAENDLKMKHLNELTKPIVEKTKCGVYVDIHDWVAAKGAYTNQLTLTSADGHIEQIKVRHSDGVHLTDAGARIVTDHLVAFLKTRNWIAP
jgi:lysophospholipase L1-like esterase